MNAHTPIEGRVWPLSDGSIILPKTVADAFGWSDKTELELVRTINGVAVQPRADRRPKCSADEVFAEIAAIRPNSGPRVSDAEMNELVREMALQRYRRV